MRCFINYRRPLLRVHIFCTKNVHAEQFDSTWFHGYWNSLLAEPHKDGKLKQLYT